MEAPNIVINNISEVRHPAHKWINIDQFTADIPTSWVPTTKQGPILQTHHLHTYNSNNISTFRILKSNSGEVYEEMGTYLEPSELKGLGYKPKAAINLQTLHEGQTIYITGDATEVSFWLVQKSSKDRIVIWRDYKGTTTGLEANINKLGVFDLSSEEEGEGEVKFYPGYLSVPSKDIPIPQIVVPYFRYRPSRTGGLREVLPPNQEWSEVITTLHVSE